MTTTILERVKETEELSMNDFLNRFKDTLEFTYQRQNEIEELTDLMAKNPVDKFVITEKPDVEVCQGDILIWSELTDQFKENYPKVKNLQKTHKKALQEDDSITGDHELVPLKNSKYTLYTGEFVPSILKNHIWQGRTYACKILEIDSPFIIKHREHGNITFLTAGKYMICSSLDSETLTRMQD
jgi:hypothetical protein